MPGPTATVIPGLGNYTSPPSNAGPIDSREPLAPSAPDPRTLTTDSERANCPSDILLNSDHRIKEEYWYRIRRTWPDGSKSIVYVRLKNSEILPSSFGRRSHGPWVIGELRKAVGSTTWDQGWTALTISLNAGFQVEHSTDQWSPEYIPTSLLLPASRLPRVDSLSLTGDEASKHRHHAIRFLTINGKTMVLKSYPFPEDRPWFAQEAKTYMTLTQRGCTLMPRLLGYVYEGHVDRVNGLLLEKVEGRHARTSDYETCYRAMQGLHAFGVVHGTPTRANMLMPASSGLSPRAPKFLDFVDSVLDLDVVATERRSWAEDVHELWLKTVLEDIGYTKHDFETRQGEELEELTDCWRKEPTWESGSE